MANNWAIAIGINQYQFFQPLGCAQADAEALADFLVTEGGFLPQQCLLMTDTSPPLGDRSTYPTKENILLLLEDLAAACWQPQDRVWIFFSGYGVNYNGQDYLMPVFGNPERVEETGIEVRQVMQSLQIANLDALVLLDINRAFSTLWTAPIGHETIELAQELQISTIVSCQPEQFSHESSELGHGFFTAALLEALRSGHTKTTQLERYLSVRTPELCQHYWRPTQNPVTVIAPSQPVILPQWEANSELASIPAFGLEEILPAALAAPLLGVGSTMYGGSRGHFSRGDSVSPFGMGGREENLNLLSHPIIPSPSGALPIPPSPEVASNLQNKRAANTPLWHWSVLWGASTMLVIGLIVVVFLRNKAGFRVDVMPTSHRTATRNPQIVLIPKATTTPLPPLLEPESPISSPTVSTANEKLQKNQALLELAKMSLKQTQASDLSLAITTARKIQPGEPLYEQAQENIKIWSSMILDLAQSRAQQTQFANAIATAQLIGKNELLYPKAQASINQWRHQAKLHMANRTLLDAANALIEPKQASTYNRAIEVAKKVPADEPGFDDAKKSIDNWSEKIFSLANRRAARGELKAAIETAVLVPEETAAYSKAQAAIKKWQKQSGASN